MKLLECQAATGIFPKNFFRLCDKANSTGANGIALKNRL